MRRKEPAIELHAFDNVDISFVRAAFFDGDDAVLADLGEGFGKHVTDFGSLLPAMVATCLMSVLLFSLIGVATSWRFECSNHVDGFLDAAGQRHWIGPGRDHFQAFAEDGFAEHGRCRGSVSGDVVGFAEAASLTSWAPRFSSGSSSSISSATVTPSLVTFGDPQPLSKTALRPRGPRVLRTARASLLTPASKGARGVIVKNDLLCHDVFLL